VNDLVGNLPVVELHDVDPVVEHPGGVGRVRPRPIPVLSGHSLLEEHRFGTVGRGLFGRGRTSGAAADDRDVYAFHTP